MHTCVFMLKFYKIYLVLQIWKPKVVTEIAEVKLKSITSLLEVLCCRKITLLKNVHFLYTSVFIFDKTLRYSMEKERILHTRRFYVILALFYRFCKIRYEFLRDINHSDKLHKRLFEKFILWK